MTPPPFTVVTFNVRVDAGARTPAERWTERRPLVQAALRHLAPDLLGTQEGLAHQVADLATDLPGHHWVGVGRDGGAAGEFMALFYRAERFERRDSGDFWLSDTPDRPSHTWGNQLNRMATWARLADRATGRELVVLNTHWDHQSVPARERSADLLRARVAAWPADLPLVLMGDFNVEAGFDPVYERLLGAGLLTDTWPTATRRLGDPALNSFHGFAPPRRAGRRIDWILTRGPLRCEVAEVYDDTHDGRTASDHFPVVAQLSYR